MKKKFIFGHRNPDTDSVCSAIALSYLRNKQGMDTEAKILSDINKETKFVLEYFNHKKPEFINDVKVKIKDINYKKGIFLNEEDSIDNAFNLMNDENLTAMPICDKDNKISGYVALKDIARYLAYGGNEVLETTLENIVNSLNAVVITKYIDKVSGSVRVAGSSSNSLINNLLLDSETILIVADRYRVISSAIDAKVKLIILSMDVMPDLELIAKAEKNNVTIIKTTLSTHKSANKIMLTNCLKIINNNHNPLVVNEDEYYTEFLEKAKITKHSNYPIVDKKQKCLGIIKMSDSNEYEKQEVILVDHNMVAQSVEGLDEALILEIVDHHNLGDLNTSMPVSFRSMPVGCTSTIIYIMFNENQIDIPSDIAGLMLSAIISDTLLFNSPITTKLDKVTALKLAEIANVDLETYGKELLKAASSIEGMSIKELVNNDYKSYTVGQKQLGISVVMTMDFSELSEKVDEIVEFLNTKIELGFDLSVMFVTDVIKNGSYIIYNDAAEQKIKNAFGLNEIHQGIFVKDLVSRKKQMLPKILEELK